MGTLFRIDLYGYSRINRFQEDVDTNEKPKTAYISAILNNNLSRLWVPPNRYTFNLNVFTCHRYPTTATSRHLIIGPSKVKSEKKKKRTY